MRNFVRLRSKMVSEDKWRDGIKLLTGQGVGPSLSVGEQRLLSAHLRGPFADGMDAEVAGRVLRRIGWTKPIGGDSTTKTV